MDNRSTLCLMRSPVKRLLLFALKRLQDAVNQTLVNSLNLELLQEIAKSLDEIANNKNKGMILTSSSPTVFSAGLDIMEMYKPDLKRAEAFWTTLQDVWLKLFGSNFVTAAAINGHAPAGGCLLSMSCEYRVMVSGKYTIGLNETALGIVAPTWFMDTMCHTIPIRQAEYALTTARMFTVDEALQVGLIDEAATDKADTIEKCKNFIKKFDKIPPLASSTEPRNVHASIEAESCEIRADGYTDRTRVQNAPLSFHTGFPPFYILEEMDARVYHRIRSLRQSNGSEPEETLESIKQQERQSAFLI
ncbi:unnamed protein product, partial [Iphiclides podalirius]